MDHAHPPSLTRRSPPPAVPTRLRSDRDQNVTPGSASPSARQQRLLRTRNAKFPAKKLSISGISSRFSQLIKANEPAPPPQAPATRNKENTLDHPPPAYSTASLGILEEITNSISGLGKSQPKRAAIPIFQDTPERGLLEESPYVSPYRDPSSLINSPAPFDHIQDSLGSMRLREISGNARKSSPIESPPFTVSVRARRPKSNQKSRFNSDEYIEHIERELELVKDAVYSPNTNRPWREKLKTAKADNERLRREIVDVRSAFEAEVQKTVEHMTSTEIELRRKIRSLEDDLEQKESAIHSLECQHDEKRLDQSALDTLKATIEKLEMDKRNLEQDNDSISRRNEVLTQLLALSPTKATNGFELSSPVRARNNRRPKSMMIPRMPSSPGVTFLSRPHSVVASPSTSASCYFSPKQSRISTPSHGKSEAFAPSLRRSLTDSLSRRSTLNSDASASPSSLILEHSTAEQPVKHNPKRRPRRFLPGSTQLKPLLLPTLTGEKGVLNSASTASPSYAARRELSEESIDPTTTFLSRPFAQYEPDLDAYPFSHDSESLITEASRGRAYQSLEGVLDGHNMSDGTDVDFSSNWDLPHALPSGNIDLSVEEAWGNPRQEEFDQWMYSPGQGLDDDFDLTILPADVLQDSHGLGNAIGLGLQSSPCPAVRKSSVEMPQPLFSPLSRQKLSRNLVTPNTKRQIAQPSEPPVPVIESTSQLSRKRRKLSSSLEDIEPSDIAPSIEHCARASSAGLSKSTSAATSAHRRNSSSPCLSLTLPGQTKSPLEILQQRNIGARPFAAVTIKTIYGTLSRYTSYIADIKKDPLALARRVIANAWHTNWALVGKLSWWVLGLFLGPSNKLARDQAWDWDDYDGESIAERHCCRRSKELDGQHLRFLSSSHSPERHVRFEEQHTAYRTRGSRSPAKPALRKSLGLGESLLLWSKFSIAIMLAVGGAVVKGPGEMLRETDDRGPKDGRRGGHTAGKAKNQSSLGSDQFNDPTFSSHNGPIDPAIPPARSNRSKNRSPSPPPSARMLLQSDHMSASAHMTSSPPFRFGHNEVFDFKSPCRDHEWAGLEPGVRDEEGEMETLKPVRQGRGELQGIFNSPLKGIDKGEGGGGGHERRVCDPESTGGGSVFVERIGDVALAGDVVEQENG